MRLVKLIFRIDLRKTALKWSRTPGPSVLPRSEIHWQLASAVVPIRSSLWTLWETAVRAVLNFLPCRRLSRDLRWSTGRLRTSCRTARRCLCPAPVLFWSSVTLAFSLAKIHCSLCSPRLTVRNRLVPSKATSRMTRLSSCILVAVLVRREQFVVLL